MAGTEQDATPTPCRTAVDLAECGNIIDHAKWTPRWVNTRPCRLWVGGYAGEPVRSHAGRGLSGGLGQCRLQRRGGAPVEASDHVRYVGLSRQQMSHQGMCVEVVPWGDPGRRSVPVRTFSDWGDPAPGFIEADLVAHCGPSAKGSFVQTLTLTDIATGWTECAPLLVREQNVLTEVLSELRKLLPFPLLGFDTDNDSVFMNETVRDYCNSAGIEFTRCRPYRKNDQAWVEQKNGAVVRRVVGYRRFEGLEATTALARLYATLRLFVNFFQPSFKLAAKSREGSKVRKRYHPPATPYQRLLADPRTPEETKRQVQARFAKLDPVRLLRDVRAAQQRLVEIADAPDVAGAIEPPTLEQFIAGLRIAWREGEAQPTARAKQKVRRLRRRPDPLAAVTEQLKIWFEAEPWRTSRELLERLEAAHAGAYPDGQLRTLQRRVKVWRREAAQAMVFGAVAAADVAEGLAANGSAD